MTKKSPERMCVSCRCKKEKKELLRVVLNKENEISVDKTGKANGRGAYICKYQKCLDLSKKSRALERALKTNISNEIYDMIQAQIEEKNDG